METKCEICGRPFRKPNIGLYNIPYVGYICTDCADKAREHAKICHISGLIKPYQSWKEIINRSKVNSSVQYDAENGYYAPFQIRFDRNNYGEVIKFRTLDELKELHKALGEFIENCEV